MTGPRVLARSLCLLVPLVVACTAPPESPAASSAPVSMLPSARQPLAISIGTEFMGLGLGLNTYVPQHTPPLTSGAVGPMHYVQAVDGSFAVFTKSGSLQTGPVDTNTLFTSLGGQCATTNDGMSQVLYDRQADRWVISQVSTTNAASGTSYECVAVSKTPDPSGAYWVYAFAQPGLLDRPKLATWTDGYYFAADFYNPQATLYLGARVCALERSKMLVGMTPSQQCFMTGPSFSGLLVGDHDGPNPPPMGAPARVIALGDTAATLALWSLKVDWATVGASLFDGPTYVPVTPYQGACLGAGASGSCVQQPGTSNVLDASGKHLAVRAVYRNLVTHEALVVNHSVAAGTSTGVRWYELRSPWGTPTLYQSGTVAPDNAYRWNGSLAMDLTGNIGIGYSVSSNVINPSIRVSGRLVNDPVDTTPMGESVAFSGTGYVLGTISGWGASAMNIDPSDDCTYWYTNQYVPMPHTYNWSTRVGSFRFSNCVSADFAVLTSPTTLSMDAGVTLTSTVSTTRLGAPGMVALAANVDPPGQGVTATLNPTTGATGITSTLSVIAAGTAVGGAYTVTVTGMEGTATHQAIVGVTINQADFTLTVTPPAMLTVPEGTSGTAALTTTRINGPGNVALSASVSPSGQGVTASISPVAVPSGSGATVTVSANGTAPPGPYTVTITGLEGAARHTATLAVTVPAPPDFTIAPQPATTSVLIGQSTTVTFNTTQVGPPGTVLVDAIVSPQAAGLNSSLNLTSLAAGSSAVLTLTALPQAPPGDYSVTVTGIEGNMVHKAVVAVTVLAPSDFRMVVAPTTLLSVIPGFQVTGTVTTTQVGAAGTVNFTTVISPAGQGISAVVDPASVAAGGMATITISANDTASSGIYTITVKGTEGTAVHQGDLRVRLVLPADFTMGAAPNTLSMNQGERATSTISTTQEGVGGTVAFSTTVSPAMAGVTATIIPNAGPAGSSTNLAVTATETAVPGIYTVTVKGVEGPAVHTITVPVTVVEVPADFTLTATPGLVTLDPGATTTGTVTTQRLGSAGTVALSAALSPSGRGVTATLAAPSVEAGGTTTVSVVATGEAVAGVYTVVISGTEGAQMRQVVMQARVNQKVDPPPAGCTCGALDGPALGFFALLVLSRRRRATASSR